MKLPPLRVLFTSTRSPSVNLDSKSFSQDAVVRKPPMWLTPMFELGQLHKFASHFGAVCNGHIMSQFT